MRTLPRTPVPPPLRWTLTLCVCLLVCGSLPAAAQTGGLPDNAQPVPLEALPGCGNFFSLHDPNGPPLPGVPPAYAAAGVPVYWLGGNLYLMDDTGSAIAAARRLSQAAASQQFQGEGGDWTPPDYGCALWLELAVSNQMAWVTLHNTRPGQSYQVWTTESLLSPNWQVETNVTGASGDTTLTFLPMGQRTNLFVRASEDRTYACATNQVFTGLDWFASPIEVPDAMGAVGPEHYVELLNNVIAVYTKTGGLVATTNSYAFFGVPQGNIVDPRILFDHAARCWVASALRLTTVREVVLAVCINESPADLINGWTRYVLPVHRGQGNPDFTTLGLDGNGLYLTVLQAGGTPETNAGHTVITIKKPEIYQGQLLTNRLEITNGLPVWTVQPAINFDPVATNDYAWFLAKGPPGLSGNYQGGALCYRRLQWSNTTARFVDEDWCLATNSSAYRNNFDLDGTNVATFPGSGIVAPEPDHVIDLFRAGSRLAMPVIRRGSAWACQAIGLSGTNGIYEGDQSGASVDRSAVQWFKLIIEPGGSGLSLDTYGRIYDPAAANPIWYYFPSLMVNCHGDMVAGFNGSGETNYISAYFASRLRDALAASRPQLVLAGTNSFIFGGQRWGDYSATTLDPVDDWSFWTVQEYPIEVPDDTIWATVIARIKPIP